jgi:DNA-binding NarL/FixJ family response regulator
LEHTSNFEVITFSNVADALLALSTEKFDVILSDYQMPGMDGIEFLKKVKEKHNGIPFVLFTGKGREEVAIEAINNGADFYIRKGGDTKAQFAELINAINQAVARKEAEEALTYNLRHFRTLIENATDIIAETDGNGKIRYVSPSIERTLGYYPDEMLGKLITDFVHPEDEGKVIENDCHYPGNGAEASIRIENVNAGPCLEDTGGQRHQKRFEKPDDSYQCPRRDRKKPS